MGTSGGIERVVSTLADRLGLLYEIEIAVKDNPVSFYKLKDNVRLVSLGTYQRSDNISQINIILSFFKSIMFNISKLKAYLKSSDASYYYVIHPRTVLKYFLAGGDLSRLIVSEHFSQNDYNIVYRLIRKMFYGRCRAYVVPTVTDANRYANKGLPVYYLPHFRSNLPYRNVSSKSKVVLNIGRFAAEKQQLFLLKIWHKMILKDEFPKGWRLHIIGSGELEVNLKSYVKNNNLESSVSILPPSLVIEDEYSKASVFALTSRSEGFGMVLLEAISFGIPCVCYDCPSGPRDIIKDSVTGYLIELNNEISFEKSLMNLISDDKLRSRMGDCAYSSSLKWSDDGTLSKWITILN